MNSWTRHPRHGPLPIILLILTVGTGVVDAVSILTLGRVFVANMTGNVAFIGFAIARVPGFSLTNSLVALVAFLVGAGLGGAVVARRRQHRGRLLRLSLAVELIAFAVALAASLIPLGPDWLRQIVITAVLAAALGLQNSVVRQLAVPDLTTTVLTMTLTGIAADLRRGDRGTVIRRIIVVLAMLVGALVGALVVLAWGRSAGLVLALALVAVALLVAVVVARGDRAWHAPTSAGG